MRKLGPVLTPSPPTDRSTRTAAGAGRLGAAVGELGVLLGRLEKAQAPQRPALYAECVPLILESRGLVQDPLPIKEVRSLVHETGWHLRALAGLTAVEGGTREQHATWARSSLAQLGAWSARHPGL